MTDYLINSQPEDISRLIEEIKQGVILCPWYTPGGYDHQGKSAPLIGSKMYETGDNLDLRV